MADLRMLMPLATLNPPGATGGGATLPGIPAPAIPAIPAPQAPIPGIPQIQGPPATGQAGIGGAPAGVEAGTQPVTTQPGLAPAKESPWWSNILGMAPIVLMLVALYFFVMRGQKKEEKRRKSLLSEMKRGDKVQTIGGLVARVVSIDGDEVVLKVDESANVKATYKKSAILNVIVANDEKSK